MKTHPSLLTFASLAVAVGVLPSLRAQNNRNYQSPNGGITIFGGSPSPDQGTPPTPAAPPATNPPAANPPPAATPAAPGQVSGSSPSAPAVVAPPAAAATTPATPATPDTSTDRRNYHPVNGGILLLIPTLPTADHPTPVPPPPPDKRRDYHSVYGGLPLNNGFIGTGGTGTVAPGDRRHYQSPPADSPASPPASSP